MRAALGLDDYLIMPVQRVPRYVLLLRGVLKYTLPGHPDHEAVRTRLGRRRGPDRGSRAPACVPTCVPRS
jgi:hypothetical protein